ncbi:MAG: amidohydrolase family protein [Balneolaceae bacterium]
MKLLISLFLLLMAALPVQAQTPGNIATSFAFTNVNVIPMDEERILENYTVLVDDGRITDLGPSGEITIPDGAQIIDGTGKYLMPGLAEMHGHVPPTHPSPNMPAYFNDEYVESTLFLYVAAGITTVRGMLGYEHQLELKDRVNTGELIGPNLYLAGPSFNGNSINSPEESRDKVRQQKEEGWDLLKVHPGLTRAEYDAMAETANEIGIPFGGHVPDEVGIVHALEMGQQTMDHIDGYYAYLQKFEKSEREAEMKEIVAKTKEAGAWIIPTQALWETIIGAGDYDAMKQYDELKYIPKAVISNYHNFVGNNIENNPNLDLQEAQEHAEWRRKILQEMNQQGVLILMGTDAPQLFSVPGFSIHRELPYMEEAGMSAYEIIKTGTANVGVYFADEDDFGTIAKGKRADLVLVDENPLQNLAHIQQHSGVMVQGKWYSKDMIDTKLKEIEEYYSETQR